MANRCTPGNKPCGGRCIPNSQSCASAAKTLATGAVLAGGGAVAAMAHAKNLDRTAGDYHSEQMQSLRNLQAWRNQHPNSPNHVGKDVTEATRRSVKTLGELKHSTLNSAIKWKKGAKVAGAAALGLGVAAGLKHAYDKRRDSLWASGFENEVAESL